MTNETNADLRQTVFNPKICSEDRTDALIELEDRAEAKGNAQAAQARSHKTDEQLRGTVFLPGSATYQENRVSALSELEARAEARGRKELSKIAVLQGQLLATHARVMHWHALITSGAYKFRPLQKSVDDQWVDMTDDEKLTSTSETLRRHCGWMMTLTDAIAEEVGGDIESIEELDNTRFKDAPEVQGSDGTGPLRV